MNSLWNFIFNKKLLIIKYWGFLKILVNINNDDFIIIIQLLMHQLSRENKKGLNREVLSQIQEKIEKIKLMIK